MLETIKKILKNRDVFRWVIIGLASFVALVLVFGAGVKVGTLKAGYSYRWAENYHKNFAGPRGGFMGGDWKKIPRGEFIEAHGAFGEIIELKSSTDSTSLPQASSGQESFVIKGRGDVEKIIVTTVDTVIKNGRETVNDGLKVGDRVVIIGSPNSEGQIEAKLIRIFSEDGIKLPMRPRFRSFF